MMSAVNPGVYKSLLRVRSAYPFEVGGLLMRFYAYMMNIGTITMLTLSGYSFLLAGLVSSVIALATFFISPRISKLVDERGQSRVLPAAGAITLVGLASLLVNVAVGGPEWLLFVSAVVMGFMPSPQALVRARWTFLIRTGRLGENAPELRTMFSYEGVLDDFGFMLSPSISIALAAAITPIAGLLAGGVAFGVGVVLLTVSRSTEPIPGWTADSNDAQTAEGEHRPGAAGSNHADAATSSPAMAIADGEDAVQVSAAAANTPSTASTSPTSPSSSPSAASTSPSSAASPSAPASPASPSTASPSPAPRKREKSIIRTSAMVRVLFVLLMLEGAFFAIFDTASIALAEDLGDPNIASVVLIIASFISIVVAFVFGMINLRMAQYRQLVLFAALIGVAYGLMFLIDSAESFFWVSVVGALTYAPFLIVANATCERAVPGRNLTEAITWINAGAMCGMAFGPTIGGFVIDYFGTLAGFDFGAVVALAIPLVTLACFRIIKRNVKEYTLVR